MLALLILIMILTCVYQLVGRLVDIHSSADRARALEISVGQLPRRQAQESDSPAECAVCLEPFAAGEWLRTLPCSHEYHCACIDHWLLKADSRRWRRRPTCPLCKNSALLAATSAGAERSEPWWQLEADDGGLTGTGAVVAIGAVFLALTLLWDVQVALSDE